METMGVVEIRDHSIWARHIHGDNSLKERILNLRAGARLCLAIDGVKGDWVKMDDGKDGRPTPGIKPIGETRTFWNSLQDRRGAVVAIFELAVVDQQGLLHKVVR